MPASIRRLTRLAALAVILLAASIVDPRWEAAALESPPFAPDAIDFGVRWFPAHVHFGPDGETLLANFCHVRRYDFCRLGKYRIGSDRWEILPYEPLRTYRWPVFSPDGRWIVVATAPCDAMYRCAAQDYVLARLPADGSALEEVAETIAMYPSFSADGKSLIYWRKDMYGSGSKREVGYFSELYLLDWESRRERPLTDMRFLGQQFGRPFLMPDGRHFVFSAFLGLMGPRFRSEPGKTSPSLFLAPVREKPLERIDFDKLVPLWPPGKTIEAMDVSRDGRVLYDDSVKEKKKAGNPVALAIRPPAPTYDPKRRPIDIDRWSSEERARWEGGGFALFLREPKADAEDSAVFDVYLAAMASLSPDGRQVAFVIGSTLSFTASQGIALNRMGESRSRFVDWPRLDLVPGVSEARYPLLDTQPRAFLTPSRAR